MEKGNNEKKFYQEERQLDEGFGSIRCFSSAAFIHPFN
jgi:hypothetical protein